MAAAPHHLLYEFAKAALIKIFAFPYATVCDMYCNGGADTEKWADAQAGRYIGIGRPTHYDPSPYLVTLFRLPESCTYSELTAFCDKTLLRQLTKYQKNVEASHNKGLKVVPNSIRSDNYTITFEIEEEKFPFFGKKYQLKFANEAMVENHCLVHFPSLMRLAREAGLEYVEIQNLTEFYDDNRTQFAPMLGSCGANLVDPRGKLIARSYDILGGLYSTFVFQKPDPDAIPPVVTPDPDEEQERLWRQQAAADDLRRPQSEVIPIDPDQKGILGPGPADMRLN
ncbi:unnamed protein product [Triticum turgidum subsp. durum]|uniref:mRNA (guanine-N(7))-methyltransferase n=1 Tax=Triticum turgidum subsp. durum TaxID=4567 RepID=A0A9R1P031_TRITD|nr:unnamed protein product [Triticum turgidum subsp. durum]